MTKRISKFFLFALIAAVMASALCLAVFGKCEKNKSAEAAYSNSDSIFEIYTQKDFDEFVSFAKNKTFDAKYINLYCDVTMTKSFTFAENFSGKFNGYGHKISGLQQSLFSSVGSKAVIEEIVLTNVVIPKNYYVLTSTNSGLIKNVYINGTVNEGVIGVNVGTVSGVRCFFNIESNAPFVVQNKSIGTITDCYFFADTVIRAGETPYSLLYINNGTVTGCGYYANLTCADENVDIYPFGVGDGSVNGCSAVVYSNATLSDLYVNSEYTASNVTSSYFSSKLNSATLFDAAKAQTSVAPSNLDAALPDDAFVSVADVYPVCAGMFEGKGTVGNEFLLYGDFDIKCLSALVNYASSTNGFFAKQGADINGDKLTASTWSLSHGSVVGSVSGGNYTIFRYSVSPFNAFNNVTATVNTETAYGNNDGNTSVSEIPIVVGDGTITSPYGIYNINQLLFLLNPTNGLNTSSVYAVITDDIIINTHYNSASTLSSYTVNCHINGLNNDVRNIKTNLFDAVSGSLTDWNVYTAKENQANVICNTLAGTLTRVYAYDDNAGEGTLTSGFVTTNNGTIFACENHISCEYAFAALNNGVINYSIDFASCDNFANNLTGVTKSLIAGSSSFIVDGQKTQKELDYETLSEAEYDLSEILGYEVTKSIDYPTVRRNYLTYRVPSSSAVTVYKLTDYIGTNLHYESGLTYNKADCESDICDDEEASFVWTFNGQPLVGDDFGNAGAYTVRINIGAGDNYLPSTSEQSFSIAKGTYSDGIMFSEFSTLNYDYIGGQITGIAEPVPQNSAALGAEGFVLSYGYSANLFECGEYTQTITAIADNYVTLTRTRKIYVNKIGLAVTMGNGECDYLENANFSSVTVNIAGAVGVDVEKTFKMLVEEALLDYGTYFTTSYVSGNSVGEYTIGYSLTSIKNYNLEITQGILTVKPINLPQDTIIFDDFFAEYNATPYTLTATGIPDDYGVAYENNVKTDAGNYKAKAIFSKVNYNDLVIEVDFVISPAAITLTVANVTKDYGYLLNKADFSYSTSQLKGNDVFAAVSADNVFTIAVEGYATGEKLNAGEYTVTINVSGDEPNNYRYSVTDGILTVNKVSLKTVYDNNSVSANKDFNDLIVEYTGQHVTRTLTAFNGLDYDVTITYEYYSGVTIMDTDYCVDVGNYTVKATVTPMGDTEVNYMVTEYTCSINITLIKTSITFSQATYTYPYTYTEGSGAKDFASVENFSFTCDGIPNEDEIIFECNPAIAKNAGTYTVTLSYAGTGNYSSAMNSAQLIITPQTATVTIKETYTYNGAPIEMEIMSIDYSDGAGDLSNEDFEYAYKDKYNGTLSYIASAGNYGVTLTCTDDNYLLTKTAYSVTVEKLTAYVTLGTITFDYGTVGSTNLDGNDYYIFENYLSRIAYKVTETDRYETVNFRLNTNDITGYFTAGEYTITDSLFMPHANYVFRAKNTNKVVIKQRMLNVIWTLDNAEIDGASAMMIYAGVNQNERINYKMSNFATNEGFADITVKRSIKFGANDSDIYNAGEYVVRLNLVNSPNYVIDTEGSRLALTVRQVTITIDIQDAEVMQYEKLQTPSFIVSGLVGDDVGRPLQALNGYRYVMNCAYTTTADVGQTFDIGGTFVFTNYAVPTDYVSPGTLTVITGYPNYILPNAEFIYDGTDKTVVIANVAEGTTVEYGNNVQKHVGLYTVTAVVTYPSGRTSSLSSKVTITPATPIILADTQYTAYRVGASLSFDDMNVRASLNSVIPVVNGTFSFISDNKLRAGTNQYSIKFTPTDTRNFLTVNAKITVTAYEINGMMLVYSNTNYVTEGDNTIKINARTNITLDTSTCTEIAGDLKLYKGAEAVNAIVLDKSEVVTASVMYKNIVVYSFTMEVKMVSGELEEPKEDVKVSHLMLELENMAFSEDGTKISVNANGGKLCLANKYADEYLLYVNGKLTLGNYEVSAATTSLSIIIKNKQIGINVYVKEFPVSVADVSNEVPAMKDPETSGFKTYYYYIIGGGVAAVILAVVVILLIVKRKG